MEASKSSGAEASEAALRELARVAYAIMQNPPEPQWGLPDPEDEPLLTVSPGVTSAILHAKEYQTALDTLNADSEFEAMWSAGGGMGTFFSYPGGGALVQPETIPTAFIVPALRRSKVEAPSSEKEFCSWVLDNLTEMKKAIHGEPVKIMIIHGLTGLSIPDGLRITTPWGSILGVSGQGAQAATAGRRAPTTAVLLGELPAAVEMGRGRTVEQRTQDDFHAHENRVWNLLPLAFALASTDDQLRAPRLTFSTRIVPFLGGWGASSGIPFGFPRAVVQIKEADIAGIERWAKVVDENHNPSLDIAARRLVSALNERFDPDDSLIDAVICWESLVGTKIETVNRVTSSLAILLEEDVELRRKMMTDLGNAYSVRSNIVHGQKVKDKDRQGATGYAVEIAVKALRAIYSAGEPWVSEASDLRSKRIVLGEWDSRSQAG
ncbi:hypothetical protein GCM10027090_38770 [Sinomonas soli]